MKRNADAFGQSLWDAHRHGSAIHVIERDDGCVDAMDAAVYCRPAARWRAEERQALRLAHGRVLDIGCGAGRHTLALQARGLHVLGIDQSPLAIKTARARGLRHATVLSIQDITPRLGPFDTILMLGNNFGLFANARQAGRLLRRFARLTAPDARILAESLDVYQTTNPAHLAYQRRNGRRGRMSGQVRIRVRYHGLATPYFDYLMVSPAEMRRIVTGTGWHVARVLPSDGPAYIAILEKDAVHAAAKS
jgi:SAM-dependent methyltransferase